MNKTELINSVAEAAGLTKKDATKAVEAVEIEIAASKVPAFKAGKALKDAVK